MPDDEQKASESAEQEAQKPGSGRRRRSGALPVASFTTFIQGLAGQCLIFLGAVEDPVTRKCGTDLEQAKYSIDLMQIIEDKTKGNLTEEEERLLRGLLYDLRMRYVDACRV